MVMVRRIVLAALVLALAAGLSGCVLRKAEEQGKRTETRRVSGFDKVDFRGFGDLEIVQGDRYELELTGSGDLLDEVETDVRGDVLYIGQKDRWSFWLFGPGSRRLDVRLVVPDLSRLEVSGAGEADLVGLKTESFEFRLSGAGSLVARDVDVREFVVDMSGAGSAEVSGKADTQRVTISGAGKYDGRDLESRDAYVDMSGAGEAMLWAEDTLEVRASGAGSVEYYGDPDVTSDVSGVGAVRDRGAR